MDVPRLPTGLRVVLAYLAPDIPPGLGGVRPAAALTGRRAIFQGASGS